jgi:hypothetical protein
MRAADLYALPVVGVCLVLSWAGLEKARDRAALTAVVAKMGVPQRLAGAAAVTLIAVELGVVLAIIARLPAYLPSVLVALLGVVFAGAGSWSLLTGKSVSCACFGASDRKLGWPQLAALPLWLLAAWSVERVPPVSTTVRLTAAAAGFLLLAVVRAIPALQLSMSARRDRRAFLGGM